MEKELDLQSFKEFIVHQNSKEHISRVAAYIGNDGDRFSNLIRILLENAPKYAQKAAWVLEHCVLKNPTLVDPYITPLLELTQKPCHPGVRRGIMHSLETRPMDEEQSGIALGYAFGFLHAADEKVAIKVYAMGMIANQAKLYPELLQELKLHVDAQFPHQSAAFKSKARNIYKKLKFKLPS